jgi:rhamnulokinase
VNGMWLLKQCLDAWCAQGREVDLATLVAQAAEVEDTVARIDVDAAPLMLAGEMPARINEELRRDSFDPIEDVPGNEPAFARVIFASLADRYAVVLRNLESLTGRGFRRITILGGGSRNLLLKRLTEVSTGLPVSTGLAEGSTVGNFAVQLAAWDAVADSSGRTMPELVRLWAARLVEQCRV